MSSPLVRRLRLPAALVSPSTARHEVAALLSEAGLDHLHDKAMLLTTELVTNGVLHARSEIELEAVADSEGVRITVVDSPAVVREFDVGEVKASSSEPRVGGMGLVLVARFASRWGTDHEPGERAVWFRLDEAAQPDSSDEGRPERRSDRGGATAAPDDDVDAIVDIVIGSELQPGESLSLSDLVERLATGLAAETVAINVDRGDGEGTKVFAQHSSSQPSTSQERSIAVPLRLSRPWRGELSMRGVHASYAESVATLAAGQIALLIENQRLEQAHHERRGWLLFIAEAGELLAQSTSLELTVALLPGLVVPRLGQWCAVHVINEYGEMVQMAATHVDETEIPALSADLAQSPPSVRAGDGVGPQRLRLNRDAMVFPLAIRGEQLGALTVGRPADRTHTPEELAIIADLSRRAAVAMDNARTHDLHSRIATTLQQPLLPPALPVIDGLEVAAQYAPAGSGLDVGGDFYDLIPLPGSGWLFVIGDVSGKGAAAAAVTGLVRDVLHALVLDYHDPEFTLSRLNEALLHRGGGNYATLALGLLTMNSPGAFDVSLHLAGHNQPVLLRPGGTVKLVGQGGTALGLLDAIRTPRTSVRLNRGDALVFYTDGVTERRRHHTLYGTERLLNTISALSDAPAAVLAAELRAAVLGFSPDPPRDDIAIVALKVP